MKAINWIVLAVLAAFSIMFVALYFMLGFNLVDWPQGLVLGIIWWISIIAVAIGLQIQKRYFIKKDKGIATGIQPPKNGIASPSNKKGVSNGTLLITAILVPTLVLCPCFSTNPGFADDVKGKAASQSATSSPSSENDGKATAQPHSDAARSTGEENGAAATHSNQFMSYYMLSIETVGVDVFYSINDSALEQIEPGCELETSFTDKIEFFVRPQVGYLTTSTFLHSANPDGFVDPNSSGIYSKIGENELSGFENAVKSALELGCTKEFHFTNKGTSAITKYKYRQFLITAEPFAITATFDLEGGTLDGSPTYVDDDTYYGPDVVGHRLDNIIKMPKTAPIKEGFVFTGWDAPESAPLYAAGASVDVTNFWHYLYENSDSDGAVLPFEAQWKEDVVADAPSEAPDGSGNNNGSDSEGSMGAGTTDNGESGNNPGNSNSGNQPENSSPSNGDNAPSGTEADGGATSNIQGATSPSHDSGSAENHGSSQDGASDPFAGSEEHGRMLASRQHTAGSLRDGMPLKNAIASTSNALRDGIYTIEDAIIDDPVAQGYGIAFSNRGCWVCDYLKAGIVLTLLYGAIVIVYRAARRNRKNIYANDQEPIVGAVSA